VNPDNDPDYEREKARLEEQRARLIRDLNSIGPAPQGTDKWKIKETFSADLRTVNAQLKQLNIDEATRLREIAQARRTRGLQEHEGNLERATMKKPPPVASVVWGGKKEGDQLSRGEFLLKEAAKMSKTIAGIGTPEPFTVEFKAALDRYIIAQRDHVLARRKQLREARIEADFENADPYGTTKEVEARKAAAEAKANSSEEWDKTWKGGSVGE
jgi:hypothetical protein